MHALTSVDLDPGVFRMYAHELSGGMKQRVCIAIGILLQPQVIIADEPTSALDVVTQRQVMETIDRVQNEINAAVILIGHDMGLMAQFVDKVAVMYAGRLVEISTVREMFTDPKHPYAQALINSLPSLDNKGVFQGIPGLAPSLLRLPSGCAFHPRCPNATDLCRTTRPEPVLLPGGRIVTCHLFNDQGVRWRNLLELRHVSKVYSRGLISAHADHGAARHFASRCAKSEPTILTVAGESGSGKTTLAMLLLGFIPPTTGADHLSRQGHQRVARQGAARFPPRSAGRVSGPVRGLQSLLQS